MRRQQLPDALQFQHYLTVSIILLAVGTAVTIVQYKVPSILGPIMSSFSMSPGTASWLMSVFTAVGIVLSIPTGVLSRKIGPKRVLLAGCGVIVVGSVVGAFASSAYLLIASRAIEGIAFVFVSVAGPLAIDRYVDPARRGTANGIWSLWICLGSVLGASVTPLAFDAAGLTGTWLLYAGIVVAVAIALALLVKSPGNAQRRRASVGRNEDPIQEIGTVRSGSESESAVAGRTAAPMREVPVNHYRGLLGLNPLLYFGGYLVFNILILAVLSYTPTFLQGRGWNASLSGFASALPGLIAVVSSPLFGILIDWTKRTKPFYLLAMTASGPATYLMLTQDGMLFWAGALIMGGIGYGVPVACLSSLSQIAGKPEAMATAMSVLMLVQCLGEFLGSLVTPLLLGDAMANWAWCGAIMGLLGIAGTVAIAFCRFR